jgi:hypothetical protein
MEDETMASDKDRKVETTDENRDPITGAPGSHPVGTGVGATVGGAAGGAALGAAVAAAEGAIAGTMVGGPVGTAIGTAVGVVAGAIGGGYAGKAVAERIDPTAEEAYWNENYRSRPYVDEDETFDDYAPAYRYGWESRERYPDRNYEDIEAELEQGWQGACCNSKLDWSQAKFATRDAWDRVCGHPDRFDQEQPLPKKG